MKLTLAQLRQLYDLQELDARVAAVAAQRFEGESRLKKLRAGLRGAGEVMLELTVGLESAEQACQKSQDDLSNTVARRDKSSERLSSTSNPKEAQNLQREADSLARRVTEYADALSQAQAHKQKYAERIQQLNIRIAEIKAEADQLERQEAEFNADRQRRQQEAESAQAAFVQDLSAELLQLYADKSARLGYAVGRAADGTCDKCYLALNRADLQAFTDSCQRDEAFSCPSCAGFLLP